MSRPGCGLWAGALLVLAAPVTVAAAEETVATAVYAKVGQGYKRAKARDGTYKPEYYALSNGGRIYGTTTDSTVDPVTYFQVSEIAKKLLAQQRYHYAQSKEQAKLLIVLQWGSTIGFNRGNSDLMANYSGAVFGDLQNALRAAQVDTPDRLRGSGDIAFVPPSMEALDAQAAKDRFDSAMTRVYADNTARDQFNQHNARILGYMDDLADSNDIRRWAGGGDRFTDLLGDIEESRYYIVISAFDFPELMKTNKKKLLWQVRVSVRSPGNRFDDSVIAMMKTASRYFGQDSGKLVRGEESKGTVELGDLKFLGVTKEPEKSPTKEKK